MGNAAPIACDHSFNWEEVNNAGGTVLPGREGHGVAYYNESLYYFGGIQDCVSADNSEEEVEFPTACMNDLYQYDIKKNEWEQIQTTGDIPSPRSGFVCEVLGDLLFIYGGLDPLYGWLSDGFTFDFGTKKWSKVQLKGDIPTPRDKIGCAKLSEDKLIVFGGFGPQEIELEEGEEETATFGWFNDVYTFDITDNSWRKLDCKGDFPTPRAAAGVAIVTRPQQVITDEGGETQIPQYQEKGDPQPYLYVMGGRDNQGNRTNDLYSLELSSLTWSLQKCRGTPPVGRSFHSCVAINDKLFVFGGTNSNNQVLGDIHLLDTKAQSQHAWIQPKDINTDLSKQPSARAFHATVAISLENDIKVYVHGGTSRIDEETGEHQNLCHNLWKISLNHIVNYRAPTPPPKESENTNKN